jgi:hypothetical protein
VTGPEHTRSREGTANYRCQGDRRAAPTPALNALRDTCAAKAATAQGGEFPRATLWDE